MNVHVRGTWLPCRAAARHWRDRNKAGERNVGGRIINTTSGAGLLGNFGQTNYATAKAAIVGPHLDAQPRALQARGHGERASAPVA